MAKSKKITTPKGKQITVSRYLELAIVKDCHCEEGHLGCAAWDNGPCSDELLSEADEDEKEKAA